MHIKIFMMYIVYIIHTHSRKSWNVHDVSVFISSISTKKFSCLWKINKRKILMQKKHSWYLLFTQNRVQSTSLYYIFRQATHVEIKIFFLKTILLIDSRLHTMSTIFLSTNISLFWSPSMYVHVQCSRVITFL